MRSRYQACLGLNHGSITSYVKMGMWLVFLKSEVSNAWTEVTQGHSFQELLCIALPICYCKDDGVLPTLSV